MDVVRDGTVSLRTGTNGCGEEVSDCGMEVRWQTNEMLWNRHARTLMRIKVELQAPDRGQNSKSPASATVRERTENL